MTLNSSSILINIINELEKYFKLNYRFFKIIFSTKPKITTIKIFDQKSWAKYQISLRLETKCRHTKVLSKCGSCQNAELPKHGFSKMLIYRNADLPNVDLTNSKFVKMWILCADSHFTSLNLILEGAKVELEKKVY